MKSLLGFHKRNQDRHPFVRLLMGGLSFFPETLSTSVAIFLRQWLYGSAASRKPSPTRLNASTATTTNTPGSNSQGAWATV